MSRDFAGSKSNARSSSAHSLNVLGRGMRVRGRLSGAGSLRIEGEIEGDVQLGGALELGASGSVTGNLQANSVLIEGALTGDVESGGAVVIRAGARVIGNMNGSEIALEEGASFSGRIEADFELPDGLGSSSAAGGANSGAANGGRRGGGRPGARGR